MSLYEEKPVTAGSIGGDDSSAKAVIVTALVTGRRTELRRFQISPDHEFHRKGDSSRDLAQSCVLAKGPTLGIVFHVAQIGNGVSVGQTRVWI